MNKKYNLTTPQKSIYLIEQYYSNTNINNICGTAVIEQKINFEILEKAINFLIESNDSFRIKFVKENNTLLQYVEDYTFTKISLEKINSNEELAELENNLVKRIFNLEDNYYELKMFKFPDSTGGFILNIHHILADSWTLGLTCKKIMQAYNNLLNNEGNIVNENNSYIKYIESESNYFKSQKFIKDKEYWENKFDSLPSVVSLPSSQNNATSAFNCNANRLLFTFSKDYVNKILDFCSTHKISTFNFFISVLATYIHKISSANKFVIGTPILNRTNYNEKNTTGAFINIAPFLINIDTNKNFGDLLSTISSDSLGLLRHQRYPYSEILKYVRAKDSNFPTLFNVLLSYQITIANNQTNIPHTTRWTFNGTCSDDLDIQIYDINETHELNISYDYKTTKFNKKDINNLHNHLLNIINQVIEKNDISIKDINLLSQAEKDEIINKFNNTSYEYNKTSTIVELFEKQVQQTPNKTAIIFEDKKITYSVLNKKANMIANYLRDNHNIKPGDFVSILLKRSIDLIACILGIVKSGATYVAIDPDYPTDRINYMINNCESKLVFASNDTEEIISELPLNKININAELINTSSTNNPIIITNPNDLLYVIYTSGSTGKPKGVSIKNYNVINFVEGMRQIIDFSNTKSMLSVATVCFDMFVFELWGCLLNGLKLILANENEQKLPNLLNNLCIKHNVDIFQTTPSRFNLFFENNNTECFSKIKHILVGGESVPKNLFENFNKYSNLSVHHMYGPTETTVWSTHKLITDINKITIGKPIINTQIYILDENRNICPIGVPGEIYISGDGVGNGYLNNKDLTQKAFISNPFIQNTIFYKTGDLGMYNSNGEIIYLNRIDNQIKIRGYRIELDDISSNILKFNGITKCVVVDKENKNGKKYLAAYYVSKEEIDISKLKNQLISSLPNYMIPSYFIKLDELPLTLNHKIDRKSLPEPEDKDIISENVVLPTTETEHKLLKLIKKELEINSLSTTQDLFDFNIDSLNIINIQIKLLDLNIKVNTQDFYKYRTIQKIAKHVDTSKNIKNINYIDEDTLKLTNSTFNKHIKKASFIKKEYNTILLTGVTGYLGIHILNELIEKTNSKIICLLRNKTNTSINERLTNLYKFYFNKDLSLNRLKLIETDITQQNLGLSKTLFKKLTNSVDLVINTAANVRYYGNYEEFRKINVQLPDNLSDFCLENKIKFIHISTLGVSGNYLINSDKSDITFTEDDFYIGQKYTENVYIQTKFEAEMLLYKKFSKGLDVSIIRVGNLTGRYNDGHFQNNIEENAFYNILRMILKYNILPNTMLNQYLEFTPVDLCANSILNIIQNIDFNGYVFHLFNNNYLLVKELLNILKEIGFNVNLLSGTQFKKDILDLSIKYPEENILKGIVNDLDDNTGLSFSSTVQQKNTNTNYYLNKLGFTWPNIDKNYIIKIIEHMKKNKYI